MSTLWTPSGDQPDPSAPEPTSAGSAGEPSPDEVAAARAEMDRIRAELAQTPVADIVANHAIGLWQLAIVHLGIDDEAAEANLTEAKLAIDSMASLVEGVVDRLGDHGEPLRQALTNLRLAYVNVSRPDAPTEAEENADWDDEET